MYPLQSPLNISLLPQRLHLAHMLIPLYQSWGKLRKLKPNNSGCYPFFSSRFHKAPSQPRPCLSELGEDSDREIKCEDWYLTLLVFCGGLACCCHLKDHSYTFGWNLHESRGFVCLSTLVAPGTRMVLSIWLGAQWITVALMSMNLIRKERSWNKAPVWIKRQSRVSVPTKWMGLWYHRHEVMAKPGCEVSMKSALPCGPRPWTFFCPKLFLWTGITGWATAQLTRETRGWVFCWHKHLPSFPTCSDFTI